MNELRIIGVYSPEERKKRIQRFLDKRKRRIWTKKVKYDVRKNFADSRIRVKGRFVRKEDEEQLRFTDNNENTDIFRPRRSYQSSSVATAGGHGHHRKRSNSVGDSSGARHHRAPSHAHVTPVTTSTRASYPFANHRHQNQAPIMSVAANLAMEDGDGMIED